MRSTAFIIKNKKFKDFTGKMKIQITFNTQMGNLLSKFEPYFSYLTSEKSTSGF